MSDGPLVSILTVTYQHEKFIAELIESALSQTYPHIEIIISDDGSQDGTPGIIREYAMKDSRIKPVLSERNEGLSNNFNKALKHCDGSLIACTPGDDVIMPKKIEAQVNYFSAHDDCGALSHDSLVINEEGNTLYTWSDRHMPLTGGIECQFKTNWLLQKDCRPAPPSMMYRREFLFEAKYDPRVPVGNEWLHPIECAMKRPDLKWCYIPNILSKYRRSSRQMSQDAKISAAYYEERMLVLAIALAKYPELSSLISTCRVYTQFQFLVFNWHTCTVRKGYEAQFFQEAGIFRWLYMKCVYYLFSHPGAMSKTRFVRKFLLKLISKSRHLSH
jgi:glycosyltransferase involved in cell wall biosynthesis